ncbi:MAG: hypothetical protein QGF53_15670 [Alphaproteobacteria bacterium]|jgi:hypothetical protein|nr:hypothetical protein [Alphaproteobacteria bacterium]
MVKGIGVSGAIAASVLVGSITATAMPIEQDWYEAPGVTEDGTLDIREVDDNASEMDIRLTRQIMVLQQQILQLQKEMAAMRAKMQQ